MTLYSVLLYCDALVGRTYAAWFCIAHPRRIIVTGHTDDSDYRVSTPGWHAKGWRMRASSDLDDADAALGERGWRRTGDWESVASGYVVTVERQA